MKFFQPTLLSILKSYFAQRISIVFRAAYFHCISRSIFQNKLMFNLKKLKNMSYFVAILWFISWLVLIYISFRLIKYVLNKVEKNIVN